MKPNLQNVVNSTTLKLSFVSIKLDTKRQLTAGSHFCLQIGKVMMLIGCVITCGLPETRVGRTIKLLLLFFGDGFQETKSAK